MTLLWAWRIMWGFNLLLLLYFLLLNFVYLTNSILAFGALRRQARRLKLFDIDDLVHAEAALPVTVIIPGFNEEAVCINSVLSALELKYPNYAILFVNDGSLDATLERLAKAYDLEPATRIPTSDLPTARVRGIYHSRRHANLWVIDKENAGKSDALNAGINQCQTPLFCAIDSDTLLEPQAITRLSRPFLEDDATIATGGIVRILNGCVVEHGTVQEIRLPRRWIAKFQVLEYLRSFLAGRMGWEVLDATLIISGALGLFHRGVVVEAGGYATDTVGEDMELVPRLHGHCRAKGRPYRVTFVPDPVAWTECPEDLRTLRTQRDRWQRGLMDALSRHRHMLFNWRYGKVGLLAFPYLYFLEMLGPVIEICGYIAFALLVLLGKASPAFILTFTLVAVVLGIAISIAAVILEELSFRRYPRTRDLLELMLLAVLENFGYRQLMTYWRFRGVASALLRRKAWGHMHRTGAGA